MSISRNAFLRVVAARNLPVVATFSTRSNNSNNNGGSNNESQSGNARFRAFPWSSAALVGASAIVGFALLGEEKKIALADDKTVDWVALRKDIAAVLQNDKYDDGSYGPVLIRLAWHACGTYDVASKTGGSDGATMRFEPESKHGANAGLHVARGILEAVKQRHPAVSYSDLWQFAAVVAIEEMGGPKIPFRPGRVDKADSKACTPDGRLPDAAQAAQHLRDIFYRMGFNDQEIVALSGAHTLGRCHTDRSGFDGPWTKAPTMFSNSYFVELLEQEWKPRDWKGPKQFADKSGELMMLPSDLALIQDEKFLAWVKKYKADEELFFKDFAAAFQKLQELGVAKLGSPINSASSSKAVAAAAPAAGAAKPWYQFW